MMMMMMIISGIIWSRSRTITIFTADYEKATWESEARRGGGGPSTIIILFFSFSKKRIIVFSFSSLQMDVTTWILKVYHNKEGIGREELKSEKRWRDMIIMKSTLVEYHVCLSHDWRLDQELEEIKRGKKKKKMVIMILMGDKTPQEKNKTHCIIRREGDSLSLSLSRQKVSFSLFCIFSLLIYDYPLSKLPFNGVLTMMRRISLGQEKKMRGWKLTPLLLLLSPLSLFSSFLSWSWWSSSLLDLNTKFKLPQSSFLLSLFFLKTTLYLCLLFGYSSC